MKFFLALLSAFFCVMLFSINPVFADTVVTQWGYETGGIFTAYQDSTPAFYGDDSLMTLDSTKKLLSWGFPASSAGKSSIKLSDKEGEIDTNGVEQDAMIIVHSNNPLNANYPTLVWGEVTATLSLHPILPDNDDWPVDTPDFDDELTFAFFETLNSSYEYDMFALLTPGLTKQSFEYDNITYQFEFGGFQEITDATYISLFRSRYSNWKDSQGNWLPVYGWLTPEGKTTELDTWLKITGPNPVPEPSTMLLLGAGLLGLGAVARRRRQN